MLSLVDFVRESAVEHPILELRRQENPHVGGLERNAFKGDQVSTMRVAVTALHRHHLGNVLSPLAQYDKLESLSRDLSMAVIAQHSGMPLFGEGAACGLPRSGLSSCLLRGGSIEPPLRRGNTNHTNHASPWFNRRSASPLHREQATEPANRATDSPYNEDVTETEDHSYQLHEAEESEENEDDVYYEEAEEHSASTNSLQLEDLDVDIDESNRGNGMSAMTLPRHPSPNA